MHYDQQQVTRAFKIFAALATRGEADQEAVRVYLADDDVRGLVEQFAKEVDCTVIVTGERLYLLPLLTSSPFHVTNETIKSRYLTSRAVNADIYLMYVAIIVLLGEFYDSYQTTEPTRDFLPMSEWLRSLNQHLLALKELEGEELEKKERELEFNWKLVVEKWDALNDLKETAKAQDGRTVSRLGFLHLVRRFLQDQDLVRDIGEEQLELTEKTRIIVQRYYMEVEHNRGILEFMYQLQAQKERA